MNEIKETQRASVHIGYDGRVHKRYKGPLARERFENEVRVLKYLEEKGCEFVPKVLKVEEDELYVVTTNCGRRADHIGRKRAKELFKELEGYGVKHDDPFPRNITYDPHQGRFCIIDFEFAVITETGEGLTLKEAEAARKK